MSRSENRIASGHPSWHFISNCHLVPSYPICLLLYIFPTNSDNFLCAYLNYFNTNVLSTCDISNIKPDPRGTNIEKKDSLPSGNYNSKGNECINKSWWCNVNIGSESESPSVMLDSLQPHGVYSSRNSPGENTGVGSLSHLQGSFSTQGSNPGLSQCRCILYQLNHRGSPLET